MKKREVKYISWFLSILYMSDIISFGWLLSNCETAENYIISSLLCDNIKVQIIVEFGKPFWSCFTNQMLDLCIIKYSILVLKLTILEPMADLELTVIRVLKNFKDIIYYSRLYCFKHSSKTILGLF